MKPLFKTAMLIYLSKADLDEKILFGKITHHLDLEIRKMLLKGFRIPFWSMIYMLSNLKVLFLKLTM